MMMKNKLNIKRLGLSLIVTLLSVSAFSQTTFHYEKEYSDYIQTLLGGEREVSVASGRVDLVTDEYAFEIKWANKWKEAIGQSIWYGLQTNKTPGIIIILKDITEYKYFIQLNTALEYANLTDSIKVMLYPNDFEALIKKKNN